MPYSINPHKNCAAEFLKKLEHQQEIYPADREWWENMDSILAELSTPVLSAAKREWSSILEQYDAAIGILPIGIFNAITMEIPNIRLSSLGLSCDDSEVYGICLDSFLVQFISNVLIAYLFLEEREANKFFFSSLRNFDTRDIAKSNQDAKVLSDFVRLEKAPQRTLPQRTFFDHTGQAVGHFLIGHEVGHIIRGHFEDTKKQQTIFQSLPDPILTHKRRWVQEFEADEVGAQMARSAGLATLEPQVKRQETVEFCFQLGMEIFFGSVAWWEVIHADELPKRDTHPPAIDRIQRFRRTYISDYLTDSAGTLIMDARNKFERLIKFTKDEMSTSGRWFW